MTVTTAMKGYGRFARTKAEAMSQRMKDRILEKRLDRAQHEADRLRFENEMLRDEVEETRAEHRKILDMLEDRLSEAEDGRSHKGRWMLFLLALGGGAYALIRSRRETTGTTSDPWSNDSTSGIRAGTTGL